MRSCTITVGARGMNALRTPISKALLRKLLKKQENLNVTNAKMDRKVFKNRFPIREIGVYLVFLDGVSYSLWVCPAN